MIDAARKAELQTMIVRMQKVSDSFYQAAQWAGHHAFLEFTGLMNEYIQLCRQALASGTDFTATTIHGGGQTLPMEAFHQRYLNEKLSCIYGVSLEVLMNPSAPLPKRAKPTKARKSAAAAPSRTKKVAPKAASRSKSRLAVAPKAPSRSSKPRRAAAAN